MDVNSFLRSYCRSPLGITSFFLALGIGVSASLLGLPAILSVVLGFGGLAAIVVLSLAFGFAQASAIAEADRVEAEKARSRLAQADDARKRLASLRLCEPELASARDLVVLEAGKLVEDCSRRGVYDPQAVQAVLDSVELVDAYLKEADESSTERRFSMPEAHPFPEAASRTTQALREKATLIAERRENATGEIPGSDRIAIEEELK